MSAGYGPEDDPDVRLLGFLLVVNEAICNRHGVCFLFEGWIASPSSKEVFDCTYDGLSIDPSGDRENERLGSTLFRPESADPGRGDLLEGFRFSHRRAAKGFAEGGLEGEQHRLLNRTILEALEFLEGEGFCDFDLCVRERRRTERFFIELTDGTEVFGKELSLELRVLHLGGGSTTNTECVECVEDFAGIPGGSAFKQHILRHTGHS